MSVAEAVPALAAAVIGLILARQARLGLRLPARLRLRVPLRSRARGVPEDRTQHA